MSVVPPRDPEFILNTIDLKSFSSLLITKDEDLSGSIPNPGLKFRVLPLPYEPDVIIC